MRIFFFYSTAVLFCHRDSPARPVKEKYKQQPKKSVSREWPMGGSWPRHRPAHVQQQPPATKGREAETIGHGGGGSVEAGEGEALLGGLLPRRMGSSAAGPHDVDAAPGRLQAQVRP